MAKCWSISLWLASLWCATCVTASSKKETNQARKVPPEQPKVKQQPKVTEPLKETAQPIPTKSAQATDGDTVNHPFPTLDLFYHKAGLAYDVCSQFVPQMGVTGEALAPVYDALNRVPTLGSEVFQAGSDIVNTHGPKATSFLYDSASGAEVYLNAGRQKSTELYKENLSEVLDPHFITAQKLYDEHAKAHVEFAMAKFQDVSPIIVEKGSGIYRQALELSNEMTKKFNENVLPAAMIGANAVYGTVLTGGGVALQPIHVTLPHGKKMRFSNGVADIFIALAWTCFVAYLGFFMVRHAFGLTKLSFKMSSFIILSVIAGAFKTVFATVWWAIRLVARTAYWFLGLFFCCWCCCTCARKKRPKTDSKGTAAASQQSKKGQSKSPPKPSKADTKAKPAQQPTSKQAEQKKQAGKRR